MDHLLFTSNWILLLLVTGARGGAVGWGTALQARRSWIRFPMVSLEFFIDTIFPTALRPWVWLSSNRNEYQEYFLGVKAAGAYGWQPYDLHVPTVLKSGSLNLLEPSGPAQACNGIALPYVLYYTYILACKIWYLKPETFVKYTPFYILVIGPDDG
jgi:hypothetical protein